MSIKLLTEYHLEFLSLTGGCTGSSESTLVKIPHCWKSHVTAHIVIFDLYLLRYKWVYSQGKTTKLFFLQGIRASVKIRASPKNKS